MSEELRECPFCHTGKGKATYAGVKRYIYCDKCHVRTLTYDTIEEAITAWNTRPAEDALKAENESLKEKVKSEKLTNISLGETITRASIEASRAKTECARLKAEVEELRYIVEQFAPWYNENGCPKYFDSDFPCSAETEYKNDPETEGDFDEWNCWKEGNDAGCWVEYYRWKYKQEKEKGCKDE